MLTSLYFTILPILIVCIYIFVKFFLHKNVLEEKSKEADYHNFEDARDDVFLFFEEIISRAKKTLNIFLHWLLHIFVIVLGWFSDLMDFFYAKSRDFFLQTAVKEKDVVATFWAHLKDYRREKVEEEGKK